MKIWLPVLIVLATLITSCGPADTSPEDMDLSAQQTMEAIKSVLDATPISTKLPPPTKETTNTPKPTSTPKPTIKPTKIPDPIVYDGKGANVIDFDISSFNNIAFVKIENSGSSNFAVWMLNNNNEQVDLLVNTIGKYSGYIPINFIESTAGSKLQVDSSGTWKITFYPLAYLLTDHMASKSKPYSANSDDIIYISDPPALATFNTNSTGNFAVWADSRTGRDLLINEIAPYTGVVPIKADVLLLIITATGPWTLELK